MRGVSRLPQVLKHEGVNWAILFAFCSHFRTTVSKRRRLFEKEEEAGNVNNW